MRLGWSLPSHLISARLTLSVVIWLFAAGPGMAVTTAPGKHVVILKTLSSPLVDTSIMWLHKELRRRGFVEGKTVSYRTLDAGGDAVQAISLLSASIAEQRPDLVVTVATLATRAGRTLLSTTRIPQLFMIVTDPIGEGLTSAVGESSGTNLTGLTHVVPAEYQLAVVSRILATAKRKTPFRLAILRSDYPSAKSEATQLMQAAPAFPGVELVELGFHYAPGDSGRTEARKRAVQLVREHRHELDGLWLVAGPNQSNPEFFRALHGTGIPIVNSSNIENARKGAMVALQATADNIGKGVAEMAAAMLAGTDPSTIPVTRPRRFEAGVNVTTATKLGAVIPSAILELAQRNVFH